MKLVYRGIPYTSIQNRQSLTSQRFGADAVPQAVIRLQYRGVPYIHFCYDD